MRGELSVRLDSLTMQLCKREGPGEELFCECQDLRILLEGP